MTCWLNVNEISVEKWRCFTAERLAVKFYYRRNKHTRSGGDDGQEFFLTFSHSSSLRSDLCSGGIPWCIWWRWLRSRCWCSPSRKAEWRNRPPGGEWREWIVCQCPWAPGQPPSSYTHLSHWVCVDLFIWSRHLISSSCLSVSLNSRTLPQAWRHYPETVIVPLLRFPASLDSVFCYWGMIF